MVHQGDIVLYYPIPEEGGNGEDACTALVTRVHNENCVGLAVFPYNAPSFSVSKALLRDPNNAPGPKERTWGSLNPQTKKAPAKKSKKDKVAEESPDNSTEE